RISALRLQIKLAGAGLATGVMMMVAGEASAQKSPLGPFIENLGKNPFPAPAFQRYTNPALTFWDFDNDGDLDATFGTSDYSSPQAYQNNGDKTRASY